MAVPEGYSNVMVPLAGAGVMLPDKTTVSVYSFISGIDTCIVVLSRGQYNVSEVLSMDMAKSGK